LGLVTLCIGAGPALHAGHLSPITGAYLYQGVLPMCTCSIWALQLAVTLVGWPKGKAISHMVSVLSRGLPAFEVLNWDSLQQLQGQHLLMPAVSA
jgi:hypothetical protein